MTMRYYVTILFSELEGRHQAKTVSQIKEFVGKLTGLQAEHHALRLRISSFHDHALTKRHQLSRGDHDLYFESGFQQSAGSTAK
jgi:hypothetical protein